jgi:hypothetical protein
MGPPMNYPPQPVEIDPLLYSRNSGPYAPWDSVPYSMTVAGEPNPLLSSITLNKAINVPPEYGARNGTQHPLDNWLADGPWVPKGAVPEGSMEERPRSRASPQAIRRSGYVSPFGVQHRPRIMEDLGGVHYGFSTSDSGYGSGHGLENASARGSDVLDLSIASRSPPGRVTDFLPYSEGHSLKESNEVLTLLSVATRRPPHFCVYCQKDVKTKSALKYVTFPISNKF